VTPEESHPSPLKEISSQDYEGRGALRKHGTGQLDHFFGLSGTKVGVITFLEFQGRGYTYYWDEIL
jgi:hypothetical protein